MKFQLNLVLVEENKILIVIIMIQNKMSKKNEFLILKKMNENKFKMGKFENL